MIERHGRDRRTPTPGSTWSILDGEAVPAGGMGLARQLKDEIYQCPPLLVLTGRAQDGWLATWARADAIVPHPIDPVRLADVAATLLRARRRLSPHRSRSGSYPIVEGGPGTMTWQRRARTPGPASWAR